MKIDRCICFDKPFTLLQEVAKSKECSTIETLQEYVVFGQKCKLCRPYVCEMLKSGQTEFSEIISVIACEQD